MAVGGIERDEGLGSGLGLDDTLKYHRVEGALNDTIERTRITCISNSEEVMAIGTEDGFVHIISLSGSIERSFKAHDRSVNDISIDQAGTSIVSCSDSGTIAMLYIGIEGEKESAVHLSEPVKCVCVEDDSHSRRDRGFVVGTASGKLIYQRPVWFTQREWVTIFAGDNSSVSRITWRGDVIAWSDADQVRLLDAELLRTLDAAQLRRLDLFSLPNICRLSSPPGVSRLNPYPCRMFWHSDSELFVGWADCFQHLKLAQTQDQVQTRGGGRESGQGRNSGQMRKVAAGCSDWQVDVIICGLTSLDANHILILGYVPPDVDEGDTDEDRPEVQIRKITGELLSCDSLPLRGNMRRGPWSYHLATSYSNNAHRRSMFRWSLADYRTVRGGSRGFSPICFMSSGQDFIVIRVRDINDRVHSALEEGDVKTAVTLAFSDRTSLRQYQLHDLMTLYIEDLLDRDMAEIAAEECFELIGNDAILWERWILAFAARHQLAAIAPYIPIDTPRLPSTVYEVALETFLQSDTREFLLTLKKWANIEPHLFDHSLLLLRLESSHSLDRQCLEAEAELHMIARRYDKAIAAYLEMEGEMCRAATKHDESGVRDESRGQFMHIFDLIEREDLFDSVKDKLANMFRLSREHTEQFLLRNIEKLPIKTVVQQLRNDRQALCWYLHMIFVNCFNLYNTPEFEDLHILQISLYAENAERLRAKGKGSKLSSGMSLQHEIQNGFDLALESRRQAAEENEFLAFLKSSSFVPLPLALEECERRNPPLYMEMVYILARMDAKRDALGLLLREVGSAYDAIRFVEAHDKTLWPDVVEYSIQNSDFLIQLLDYLGVCNIDPRVIVSRIPSKLKIPKIRSKMKQIIDQYDFQLFLHDICNDILEMDALDLLRSLNHSQRRGIKVFPQQLRCKICTRYLYQTPGPLSDDAALRSMLQRLRTDLYQVWGSGAKGDSDVLVFSNVASFHRSCFQEVYDYRGSYRAKEIEEENIDLMYGGRRCADA